MNNITKGRSPKRDNHFNTATSAPIHNAEAMAINEPVLKMSPSGPAMTTTPVKPTKAASHLSHPARSPKKRIASIIVKIGALKPIAVALANGITWKAKNINTTQEVPNPARNAYFSG